MKQFVIFACAAAILAAASLASNAGVCFQKASLLDDNQYFKSAIDVVIHDPVDGVIEDLPDRTVAKSVHSQKYSSSEEFLSEFPYCCRFVSPNSGDGDGLGLGLLDRIAGVHVVEVSIIKRYFDERQQKISKSNAKVAVTSCGKKQPFR